MKKVISLLILSAIILSVFTACSTAEVNLLSFIDNTDTALDLNGKTITICAEGEVNTQLFEQKANTTQLEQKKNYYSLWHKIFLQAHPQHSREES